MRCYHGFIALFWNKIIILKVILVADSILDKVKGQKIKKLRTIELIDTDLQLLMRELLEIRMDEVYEKDKSNLRIIINLEKDFKLKQYSWKLG